MANSQIDASSVLEEVLKVLGVDNMAVLYVHLEKLGVKRNEVADKPVEFSNALRTIFGQGASILERQIISAIASRSGGTYGQKTSLADALQKLKQDANAS
ncbi:MAG: hypothetical protein ACREA4_09505 [Nitrososphaera sp.]